MIAPRRALIERIAEDVAVRMVSTDAVVARIAIPLHLTRRAEVGYHHRSLCRGNPAIDQQNLTCDERRRRACKEKYRPRAVNRFGDAL